MKTKTILLIDDHALVSSGIAMVLKAGLDDVVVHEALSLEQALRLEEVDPLMVLLDVQLQGLSGLEGIAILKRRWPLAKIVMVSAFDVPDIVGEAVARGALAFISKAEAPGRMLQRVAMLLADDASLPANASSAKRPTLTPRQCEVLDLLCQGLPNKTIGRRLNLSEHTVRGHVQAMLGALQVSSRSEAIFAAHRLGLIR